MTVYVGSYSKAGSTSLLRCSFDATAESFAIEERVEFICNPSFLAVSPSESTLYAISEVGTEEDGLEGSVTALRIGDNGALSFLNSCSSGGAGPCHVTVSPDANLLVTSNYRAKSICAIPLDQLGSLNSTAQSIAYSGHGSHPVRQRRSHPHCAAFDPTGRWLTIADLGTDRLHIYDRAYQRPFRECQPTVIYAYSGSGPRHIAWHPEGALFFVVGELDSSVSVYAFDAQSHQALLIQRLRCIPDGFDQPNIPAEIVVAGDGRTLYVSNRGHDSIGAFRIETATGRLTTLGYTSTLGVWPRHFALTPSGSHLLIANQRSGTLVSMRITDDGAGLAEPMFLAETPDPVCIICLKKTFGEVHQ